jgi:hypothetical protein
MEDWMNERTEGRMDIQKWRSAGKMEGGGNKAPIPRLTFKKKSKLEKLEMT